MMLKAPASPDGPGVDLGEDEVRAVDAACSVIGANMRHGPHRRPPVDEHDVVADDGVLERGLAELDGVHARFL
jgi:hypothetical protein